MNQTIYFRKDIWERFKDHPNKSELVNKLLGVYFLKHEQPEPYKDMPEVANFNNPRTKALAVPGVIKGSEFVPKPPDPETGYPCCLGKRPCKHWVWNGDISAYVNSLTGKEREAV